MYGFFTNSRHEKIKILILKLKQDSWFGDFEIMMDAPAEFQVEAYKSERPFMSKSASIIRQSKHQNDEKHEQKT